MKYPAIITEDDGGFMVSFRDIPQALTGADNYKDAVVMAQDALVTAFSFYTEDKVLIPMPSAPEPNEVMIAIPITVAAKILLLNTMLSQYVSQAKLAKLMGATPQQVSRIVNLTHPTKIDTIQQALKSMGYDLVITIS